MNATSGVYVKWALKTFPATYLIDWVPSTNDPKTGGHLDAPLPPGQKLTDGAIWIQTVSVGQDADLDQWVKVNVHVP